VLRSPGTAAVSAVDAEKCCLIKGVRAGTPTRVPWLQNHETHVKLRTQPLRNKLT
jgi:hypothetical protein